MNKFFLSIKRCFIIYLAGILASFVLSFYVISLAVEPKSEEKFGVIIEGHSILLEEENLPISSNIKKTTIENVDVTDLGLFIVAQSQTSDYDVLIVSKTAFDNNAYAHALLALNETLLDETFVNHTTDYVLKDNSIYGIEVTESVQKLSASTLTDSYYICFFKNSVHSGQLNHQEHSESINFVHWLIRL